VGYPARARILSGLSTCFLDLRSPFFSLSEGISCLSEAYADDLSHVNERLRSAVTDLQQLEAACGSSTQVAQTSPRTKDAERILDLYAQAIALLPLAANLGLNHSARLQAVAGSDEIARNAATRAVLLDRIPHAVEMLEQGRGVFWTQTLHLRTIAFEDVPPDNCQELQRMLRLLDHGTRQVESVEQSADQRERRLEQRRQVNEMIQALISKIRRHPGLDRFLLPPAFQALLGSLPDGLVVIVNASKLGHHALLLQRAPGLAASLALKPFLTGFDWTALRSQLPRDVTSSSDSEANDGFRAMRLKRGRVGNFEDVLSSIWISIVSPIIDTLGLNVSVTLLLRCVVAKASP
jgi:hypothetical protein